MKFLAGTLWDLVDPVVADPVRQDNDKRKNIQIYTKFLIQAHRGIGAKESTQLFCTKVFKNPSGHERPRRKSWTSAPKSALFLQPQ